MRAVFELLLAGLCKLVLGLRCTVYSLVSEGKVPVIVELSGVWTEKDTAPGKSPNNLVACAALRNHLG